MADFNLSKILNRLQNGKRAGKSEIKYLLRLADPYDIDLLFGAARCVRSNYFGSKIFLYGFLYFSTYCRNSCRFCQYRQSNNMIPRYRKTKAQILNAAMEMSKTGVHLIDLTMGEDPELYSSSAQFDLQQFVSMVKTVQDKTKLPVMISPGTLPDKIIGQLAEAQTLWYACYQETHNKILYKTLREGQSFQKRIAKKQIAKNFGMLIEEGILTGVGETCDDLADSIIWMRDFPVDQARVMTFIPQTGTPMSGFQKQEYLKEQIVIAVMRLVLGDVLIPASLDIGGLDGLQARLDAGANVVTSIVPPDKGLTGVANFSLDIEDSRRTLKHILPILKTCGLKSAKVEEYRIWIKNRQTEYQN